MFMMPKIVIHFLLLIIVFVIPSLWIQFAPQYNQTLESGYLSHKVEIMRESNGFAHIFANSHRDSLYGLGHVHCQDRLFKMVMLRMAGQGRISEFVGERTVELDRYFLQLGLDLAAEESEKRIGAEEKELMRQYARGVNECVKSREAKGMRDRVGSMPWEMGVLQMSWEEWTPRDTILICKLTAFFLSLDYKYEVLREKIAAKIGEEKALLMMGGLFQKDMYDQGIPSIIKEEEIEEMQRLQAVDVKRVLKRVERKGAAEGGEQERPEKEEVLQGMFESIAGLGMGVKGSNNWVMAGRLTESGGVMMGSDPHLDNSIPTAWHLCELNYLEQGQEHMAVGVSMPGIPTIIIGRNSELVFSVTVLMQDNSDCFLEKVDHQQGLYLHNNTWVPLLQQHRTFKVKGEHQHRRLLRKVTRRGPLVDSVIGGRHKRANPIGEDVSIVWAGLSALPDDYLALMTLPFEREFPRFIEKGLKVRDVSLNWLVGSKGGQIGYFPMGAHPRKDYVEGGFFKDGNNPAHEWQGLLSHKEKPSLVDPPRGWISTANNRYVPENTRGSNTFGQPSTARAKRVEQLIGQLIQKGHKVTAKDMMAMQADLKDSYLEKDLSLWLGLVKRLLEHLRGTPWLSLERKRAIEQALSLFQGWDFSWSAHLKAPALFGLWEMLMGDQVVTFLKEENKDHFSDMVSGSFSFHQFLFRYVQLSHRHFLQEHPLSWVDSLCKASPEGSLPPCLFQLVNTLLQAQQQMAQQQISSWGELHPGLYPHHFAQNIPVLGWLMNRSFPSGGNSRTVFAQMTDYERHSCAGFHSSNLRFVFDLAGPSYYTLDVGQSESFFSPNYDDMFLPFQRDHYYTLSFGRQHQLYPFKTTLLPFH